MKVLCVRLVSPVDRSPMTDSPWVHIDGVYPVLSAAASPGRPVQLHIITDNGRDLGWFDSEMFMTVDSSVPSNWRIRVGEGGMLDIGPEAWMEPGFWESYYDDDPDAKAIFEAELAVVLDESPQP